MTSIFNEKDNLTRRRGVSGTHDYSGVPNFIYDDDRAEKPWQRVIYKMSKRGEHLYEPITSVPSTLLLLLLGVYLLLGYLTQLVEDDMPSVILERSLARDNTDTFSEEVAIRYLHQIVGDKPRVAGTVYHLKKTNDMKSLVDDIAAKASIPVKTDWQMVTGGYFMNSGSPFFNYYQNCSNIIAVLEGESGFFNNGTIGSSILVNCHYDSVPFALGASDNAVFCAVMAESLSKLSKKKQKLKHNIVFLFNGAEENGLQGSHAFLQHPWAKGVISVINLDAAGMNGKPAVFQVTDTRVLNAYSRSAYRPTAQAMAEFLFKSGIIPSDTDFRIFRDFGDIHGVDIAFAKWGHVYHTRNDKPSLIKPGVIQCAGNMLLALITNVADEADMEHKIAPKAAVYYDYLNVFMLTYSFGVSYVVDALFAVLGLASVWYYLWLVGARWCMVRELLLSAASRGLSAVVGAAGAALCAALVVATDVQMRYLSRAWIVVPQFWLPYVIPAIAVSQAFDAWRSKKSGLPRSLRTLQAMAATRLILSLITLVLVCVPPVTTVRYLVSVPLFIMSLTSLISITIVRCVRLTGWQHLILEVLLSLPSVMWLYSLSLRLDAMMLPVMGRSASDSPDYTVAMLNVGLAVIVTTAVSGIELLFSRKRLWLVLGAAGVACLVIMFIPFSPYEEDGVAVQRHYWFHSEIASFDMSGSRTSQTSGVLVTKLDPYSLDGVEPALAASGHNVRVRRDLARDCQQLVYCGMPLYRTSFGKNYKNAMFLYTGPPAPFSIPPSFSLESKSCSEETCVYNFVMTGGAHNMVTLWPYANVTLWSWSLQSPAQPSFSQLERPVYVIYHSTPTYMEQWSKQFSLVLNVSRALQAGPVMEVSHHSHRLYHPEHFTSEYEALLGAMPHYFNIASILSFRYNYVF